MDSVQRAETARDIAEGVGSITRLRCLLERLQIEMEKLEDRARPAEAGRVAGQRLAALKKVGRL